MAKPKLRLYGGKGEPGYQAWWLATPTEMGGTGINPYGAYGMRHPLDVPEESFGSIGMPTSAPGVTPIPGRPIQGPGGDIKPFMSGQEEKMYQKAGGDTSQRGTPRRFLKAGAEEYGEQFGEKWYNPYVSAISEKPVQDVLGATTMPASNILPPNLVEGYTGALSQYGETEGKAIMPGTGTVNKADLAYSLEGASEDYATSMDFLQQERDLIEQDKEQYESEIERIERDKETGYQDFIADKVDLQKQRERGLIGGATARAAMLLGQQTAYEKAMAPFSKSGFAVSGPGRAAFQESRAPLQEKLRGATVRQRDIEDRYQGDLSGTKEQWEKDVVSFEDATAQQYENMMDLESQRLSADVREEGISDAWMTAKEGYVSGVKDLSQAVAKDITDVSDWLGGIQGAHTQFGQALQSRHQIPDYKKYYRMRNVEKGNIAGTGQYGAPGGGWFQEGTGLPGIAEGRKEVGAAMDFKSYLDKLDMTQFGEAALGSDWQDIAPEDVDYEALTGDE